MSEQVETADGRRTLGVFPSEWGYPAGEKYSQERIAWVGARVAEHRAMKAVQDRAANQAAIGAEHVRRALRLHMLRREGA